MINLPIPSDIDIRAAMVPPQTFRQYVLLSTVVSEEVCRVMRRRGGMETLTDGVHREMWVYSGRGQLG